MSSLDIYSLDIVFFVIVSLLLLAFVFIFLTIFILVNYILTELGKIFVDSIKESKERKREDINV